MAKKILICGRTGAGKTTLAKALAPLIGGTVVDGDAVRALDIPENKLGFSLADRISQAKRMSGICDIVTAAGNHALASFVCPIAATRAAFHADYTIWIDRVGDQKYADTNELFEDPPVFNMRCYNGHPPEYWAATIATDLQRWFSPRRKTALFVGRYQPFHSGHKALVEEGIRKYGQACIGVRDESDQWPFGRVRERIDFALRNHVGKYSVIALPNIGVICYGRDVGYGLDKIDLPFEIEQISGTAIREKTGENAF